MHHGDNFPSGSDNLNQDIFNKNLGDMLRNNLPENTEKLGATGNFPEGKLNDNDEGELKMAVGTQNKKVIMDFGKPVAWIGFTPKQAREIADSLNKKANELESNAVDYWGS